MYLVPRPRESIVRRLPALLIATFTASGLCALAALPSAQAVSPERGASRVTTLPADRIFGPGGRIETMIVAHAVPGTVAGGSAEVQATVWDRETGQVLSGVEVTFTLSGQSKTATTGADGRAVVKLAVPNSGSGVLATVTASVAENADRMASTTTADIKRQVLPAGDIVFMIDESGSMSSSQQAVLTNVNLMAGQLSQSIDYSLGLWGFGDRNMVPRLASPATADLDVFKKALDGMTDSGGTEPGTDAIVEASSARTGWRQGAGRCLVLIGDEYLQEDKYTAQDAAKALQDTGATLFSITTPGEGDGYRELAVNSGGKDFDINAFKQDPAPVLEALMESCVTRIAQRPDLSITIDDNLDQVTAGTQQTYVVKAENTGAAAATGTVVTTELPADLTVVDAAGADISGNTLTWTVGDMDVNDSWTRSVVVRTAADHPAGQLEVKAQVSGDAAGGADPTPENNIDTDTTNVVAGASPSASPSPQPGGKTRPGLPKTGQ